MVLKTMIALKMTNELVHTGLTGIEIADLLAKIGTHETSIEPGPLKDQKVFLNF